MTPNTTTRTRARRLGALSFTTALALAACGSDEPSSDGTTPTTDAPAEDSAMETDDDAMDGDAMSGDAMSDMDMTAMNMGSADVTPAGEVTGAALASGEYVLLDTRPAGYDDVAGTATIARSDAGTTVTTELTGLLPNVAYVSHVHEAPCSDSGGDHFQFVDGTVEVPPNEIHLMFTSDDAGTAQWSAENAAVATEDAVAFVVHPLEFIDNKVACVDFVADDPDAIAAAIASGPAFDPTLIDGMDDMQMDDMQMDDMQMDDDG